MNLTYLRYELLRLFRNRMFFFFSLAFPLVLFLVFGATNKNESFDVGSLHIKGVLYYMVAMAGYGAMLGAIAGGGRISAERATGWNRQLRLTPLRPGTYLGAKVLTTYVVCILSIVVLFAAGFALGARVDGAGRLFEMIGLILIGLLPFVAMGVFIGHLVTPDALGPVLGGLGSLFALVGGMWFPLGNGVLNTIGKVTPGYWIAQASRVGVGAPAWGAEGWIVVAAWAVAMAALAGWAFRRDTRRV